jgi:uncharacterized membrane protein (UPF0127 family)
MKIKKIRLRIGKDIKELELKVVPRYLHWLGLMFSNKENASALLFEFKRPRKISIHSFFVSYEFIAIWLDHLGKIIETKKISSWKSRVLPSRNFVKLIEIPCNSKYFGICKSLVEDKTFKY